MNGSHIRRLERLNIDPSPYYERRGPRAMTGDELVVARLVLLRQIIANPDQNRDSRIAAAAGVAEIEACIRLRTGPDPNMKLDWRSSH